MVHDVKLCLLLWSSLILLSVDCFHLTSRFIIRSSFLRDSLKSEIKADSVPPITFIDCVKQSAIACKNALENGNLLLEVEFPPCPLDFLEVNLVT